MISNNFSSLWLILLEEIDNAIYSYDLTDCRNYFSIFDIFPTSELRRKLLEYAESRVKDISANLQTDKLPYRSLEMRLYIERDLHKGISRILQTHSEPSNICRVTF
ncbi:hypothetical protein [Lusitaniella coriacea]|uniref:hypothetical protein n=1 Tax=Lusitaniella coriacea TaxID=1983105 RepID=UPI003CEEF963